MNQQDRDLKEMRREDMNYGEQVKGKKVVKQRRPRQDNLSRYSVTELMHMEEEDYLD